MISAAGPSAGSVFLAGLVAFTAGSTWAAFSGSVGMLIAARASMGIGGAMMMPATLSIITDMFRDPAERQRAIGIWAGTTGVGIALGPIVGGLLLARFWWGSVFLINVPIAVLGVACALRLVPDSKNPAALAPDLAGALLSIAGLGLVLWSLIEAPVRGWSSPLVIGAGVGGLAVLAVFSAWERASSHPMLNIQFFRRRRFSAAVSSVGLVTFGLFGALFVLTQYLQFSLGLSGPASRGPRAAGGRGHRGHRTLLHRPRPRHRNQADGGRRAADHRQGPAAGIGVLDHHYLRRDPARPHPARRRGQADHPVGDRFGHGLPAQRPHRRRIRDQRRVYADRRRAGGGRDGQPA